MTKREAKMLRLLADWYCDYGTMKPLSLTGQRIRQILDDDYHLLDGDLLNIMRFEMIIKEAE